MEKTIKKVAYAGIGLASVADKKIKDNFNECVKEGMLFDTEGKDVVNNAFKTIESIKKTAEDGITSVLNDFSDNLENMITSNRKKEYENLQKRIINLENELSKTK
jgi:polyhydroxyalkanoate synthesis regulator phasin